MIELAQIGDVRECCGERYMLVEQESGTLVRRWYTHADDPEQRPLTSCRRCASALLPYPPTQSERPAGTGPSYGPL